MTSCFVELANLVAVGLGVNFARLLPSSRVKMHQQSMVVPCSVDHHPSYLSPASTVQAIALLELYLVPSLSRVISILFAVDLQCFPKKTRMGSTCPQRPDLFD